MRMRLERIRIDELRNMIEDPPHPHGKQKLHEFIGFRRREQDELALCSFSGTLITVRFLARASEETTRTMALRWPAAAEEDAGKEGALLPPDLAATGATNLMDGDPELCVAKKMDV